MKLLTCTGARRTGALACGVQVRYPQYVVGLERLEDDDGDDASVGGVRFEGCG